MATKNLARSVIEIGRSSRSKWGRKHRARIARRKARAFCYEAETLEDLDDLSVDPAAEIKRSLWWGEIEQLDNIGPAMRWMDSRVGRPWSEVYSELSQKFRGNKPIPVSHVVDQHMLAWVDVPGSIQETSWNSGNYFRVDDEGILRRDSYPASPWAYRGSYSRGVARSDVNSWANNRRVIYNGDKLFWTNPDEIHYTDWRGAQCVRYEAHRQGEEFSEGDYEFWGKLTYDQRMRFRQN